MSSTPLSRSEQNTDHRSTSYDPLLILRSRDPRSIQLDLHILRLTAIQGAGSGSSPFTHDTRSRDGSIYRPTNAPVLYPSAKLQDDDILVGLAKLCQGPVSTVPRLLVSYNLTSGSCVITHRNTDIQPQPNVRESSIKFARRRGVYLRTESIFGPGLGDGVMQSNEARLRKFIKEFVQPSLCNLNIEIQLDLRNKSLEETSPRPRSLLTDLLLHVPLVTHLRIRPDFHPMDVLPFLSARQPVRTLDTEAKQELSWPVPLMETLTVACDLPDHAAVFESLKSLISERGPRIHHGVATASGEADERGDAAPHPPRPLKHIAMQDKYGRQYQVWDNEQGWRIYYLNKDD
ncbi:hypothetical protein M407DRAFT_217946 [Tulasnella calospora MUT 4182]|uniref:Uncharacterized protein n=1 Tax=Tulasnella calospora MUT 4182 TaxID=1051891 RepID=A0A0C3Q0V5_9AGAM|nr:hypothetical protein M407DRAFT_217946 [Tulasnella calospora MUT 4182]